MVVVVAVKEKDVVLVICCATRRSNVTVWRDECMLIAYCLLLMLVPMLDSRKFSQGKQRNEMK